VDVTTALPDTGPADAPGTTGTRYWPTGFDARPWRFLSRLPVWRAAVWTLLSGVLFLPAVVATVLLLPWLPLSARAADGFGRLSAHWMRVPVPAHRVNRWFDWRQTMELVAQLVLGLAAFALACTVGVFTVVVAVVPFIYRSSVDGNLDLVFWHTTWPPAVFTVCWAMALIGLLLFLCLSWVITGCSVATTVASNTTTDAEVAELTRSRAVLADAFTGERRRIERDLHDGAQQYLTALQLNVATLELTAAHGGDLGAPLAEVKTNARQALDALRATVRGIYPQVLADKGLVEAVRELVAHAGIRGEVTAAGDPAGLTDTPALLLYHCAAEGLTNAVKHGGATEVLVGIDFRADATVLTVKDDGSGISGAGDVPTGTGIAGLRERAATLGGTVALTDAPAPWTTRLEMRLP
jgi:signal transduction histidine kinase